MRIEVATHTARNGTHLRDENGMYEWAGKTFPSVTTILKHVGKPALLMWAADSVARAACETVGPLDYTTLRGAPWAFRDEKARIGTATHDVLERVAKGLPADLDTLDAAVLPYAQSALAWIEESKPTFILTERACFSDAFGYAGTFDAIAEVGGRVLLLDYKTSKETYEDHAMQLAAYRRANFIAGDGGEEIPMPKVDGCAILVISPERARLYEWECGIQTFDAFLHVKALYDWKGAKPRPTLLNRKKRGKSGVP